MCEILKWLTFRDFLALLEYVFVFRYIKGTDHSADPCYKAFLLVLEEFDALVKSLVDFHSKLQLYFLWQVVQEVDKIFRFLAVIVS
jgi:membrane-anchored protein YejM (alkaline phosphatase superfamily)